MATQGNPYQPGYRNVTPPGTKTAIVLGLIVAGYAAVAMANHVLAHPNATDALLRSSPEAMPAAKIAVSAARLSTNALPASGSRKDEPGQDDEPRECRPEAGIVIECIFN
jgi:hypothetical protein